MTMPDEVSKLEHLNFGVEFESHYLKKEIFLTKINSWMARCDSLYVSGAQVQTNRIPKSVRTDIETRVLSPKG
jgi:hypothetical protein